MRAGAYEEHECVLTLTASEERTAAGLLKRAITTSSKGIIQLVTGGTPVTFMRITNPHNSTTAVCSRTLKSRCSELQAIRRVVSGGQPSVLLQNEVLSLGDEQRRALLKEAGISDEIKIGPAEVLAIKVVELLEENDRAGRLTWHNGVIYQLADDSYTNLHIALERYKEQLEHLQGMTWRVQKLHQYKVELQEAKHSETVLQQLATYMAVLIGESNPLTADLLHQSANTCKIVKQLETKIATSTAVVTREFPLNEGPFVKELDMALQSIGVHWQQYFGGTFVGNHVHKTLKLPNINTLCSAICKLAESSLPQKSEMVATRTMICLNAFSKFAKCHAIYDQNFIDEAQVHELGRTICAGVHGVLSDKLSKAHNTIKMHMIVDHAVQWARSTHVGFGILGEQGAESIHAKFNNLARAHSAIKGKHIPKGIGCLARCYGTTGTFQNFGA
eukprot:Em0001g2119a